jgi:4-hydroxy-4-methyl-2-oxoglutarate aldolase
MTGESVDLSNLARHSTATLYESGATNLLPREIRPLDRNWRVAGRAFTVSMAPGHNIWIHDAVYAAAPGDVLVVTTGDGYDFGYWGDILANAAVARGLAGLVIDGCVRDSAELIELGFPVFARGLCVRGTGKDRTAGGGVGDPITVGTAPIASGDYLVADADGVVAIPPAGAAQVAKRAAERVAAEDAILLRLAAGESTLDIYGLN